MRLAQALQWREPPDTRLTATEIAFLEASERNALKVRTAGRAGARAGPGPADPPATGVLAVAVVLLVAALGAGLVAFQQQDRPKQRTAVPAAAVDAETSAEARRAGALALTTDDIDESMLLAVAGVRLADSPETRSSLLAAIGRHPS